ncbi:adenosine receptor A3-like [Oculina patagonica]
MLNIETDMVEAGNRSAQALLCAVPFQGTLSLWFLVVSNIVLAITSTLSNTVILAALHKESSLHPPSKILLRSLALTDLCVGLVLGPLFVIFLMTIEFETWNLCTNIIAVTVVTGDLLSSLSLFTLTTISVDRLLALLLGMRYRQVVTFKRVLGIVLCFWTLSICFTTTGFWDYRIKLHYSSVAVLFCLVVSTCCYTKIYLKLLHHQAQIHVHQGQPNGHEPLNIARYRKTVSSALWVQFSVIACYLPVGIVVTLMSIKGMTPTLLLAWAFLVTVVHFNSTLNPILYCWKIRKVRRAVTELVQQIFCLAT